MYIPKFSHLRFFCAVVESGSIAAAARQMNCVASNITMRLKELEEGLGQTLFTREKRTMVVTPAGRLLYAEAQDLVLRAESLPTLWNKKAARGILNIGALDVAFLTCLQEKLPFFIKDYPEIEVNIVKKASFVLEHMLSQKEIDLAITDGPVTNTQLECRFAFHQSLYLVMPQTVKEITASKISCSTFYLFSPDCFYRQCAERWLEKKNYKPQSIQTIESYALIVACLASGNGFSCMPESVVKKLRKQGHNLNCIKMDGIGPTDVYFVWRKQASLAIIRIFMEYMCKKRPTEES